MAAIYGRLPSRPFLEYGSIVARDRACTRATVLFIAIVTTAAAVYYSGLARDGPPSERSSTLRQG